MGSCVSSHRDSESAMKFRQSFGSKTDKLVSPSPLKDKPMMINGSKEETFFDSQAWLESDCEDDFLSVNGDFTPSRGSTPLRQSFSTGTPRVNRAIFEEPDPASKPEPSPTDKKKKLSELFKESLRGNQDADEQSTTSNQNGMNGKTETKSTILDHLSNSANETPFLSRANSVRSSVGREKSVRSAQCCLPSLLSSRSFSERKKTSPAQSIAQ